MIHTIIIVREAGTTKPNYSLEFDPPSIPRREDYISIQRSDTPEPYREDMIVRQVWWRLDYPTTAGQKTDPRPLGKVKEIYVECDPAISPWSSDAWKRSLTSGSENNHVEVFSVERKAMPKEFLKKKND